MAFTVNVDFSRKFEIEAPFDTVFDVLANVPESASHFPNVDKLVDLGGNAYRWEMKKIGVASYSLQTIYASKYEPDHEKGTIKWTPVPGEGNAEVRGNWKLLNKGGKTECRLSTSGVMEVPLPKLVKMMVAPIVIAEFNRMVDKYTDNLQKNLPKRKAKESAPAKKESAPAKAKPAAKKKAEPKKKAAPPAKKKSAEKKKATLKKPAAKKKTTKKK